MEHSTQGARDRSAAPAGLRSPAFRLLLLATLTSFSGYILLLPIVPLWATEGGVGEFGAGTTTAVFMLTTVLTQLAMPWLLDHGGYRWTFTAGALLLGLPAPLLLLSNDLGPVIAISAVRGIGFGMITVIGAALSVRLVPAHQIGRAAAYYGVAIGIPNLVFLSVGVWMALNLGFETVFWMATVIPLIGAVATVLLWRIAGDGLAGATVAGPKAGNGSAAADRTRIWALLSGPLLIMLALSLSSSVVLTFLSIPLSATPLVASAALLGYGAMTVAGRWLAGNLSDRRGRPTLALPAVVLGAAGIGLTAIAVWPSQGGWDGPSPAGAALTVVGASLFGAAFGAAQNDTLVTMFRRAGPRRQGTASAVWNIGFDAGTGAGSIGLGVIAQLAGFGPAFLTTAILTACCLPLAAQLGRVASTVE
ncbi:MFS transporter [Arthrobacter castelli]|uniref:MFS transporter n=1 Tax=Arthrobacter castelli TaxID=271431 RepID=UPI0004106E2E|nr:MFS transporter [Arthrobacter castelli]